MVGVGPHPLQSFSLGSALPGATVFFTRWLAFVARQARSATTASALANRESCYRQLLLAGSTDFAFDALTCRQSILAMVFGAQKMIFSRFAQKCGPSGPPKTKSMTGFKRMEPRRLELLPSPLHAMQLVAR